MGDGLVVGDLWVVTLFGVSRAEGELGVVGT